VELLSLRRHVELPTLAKGRMSASALSLLPRAGELLSLRRHVELPTLAEGRMGDSALSLLPRAGGEGGRRPDEGAWSSQEFATPAIASFAPTTPSVPCSRQ